jgi:ATP:ADP antiporter, AAA family
MQRSAGQASRSGSASRQDLATMVAMMGLFFLVVCAVGILRPIRNSLALDGLGQTDFYKVYLVSAAVVLFVPILNRLSDRVQWGRLIPAVAVFFALNLLLFRAAYVEGSTLFGLVFYGWYDLFAAALVTQFFIVTQLFFHARLARSAYPVVIAGGALGASLGGAITGFFAERVGTPNLLLLAAGFILVFSAAVPLVLARSEALATDPGAGRKSGGTGGGSLAAIAGNRQVRLIAGMVLVTVLVKQIVDYQFNTVTKEIFVERDAISAFQGKFNAATQWLPLVVLAGMRRPLKRWGVGFAALLLPVAMLLSNVGLVIFWGLWTAVAAKGAESSLRYSAERTGREILYVPVPDEIKLKAKAYIDVAVEKGVGKVASALLIFLILTLLDFRSVALVGAALSVVWIGMALAVRREYVRALADAVENRFASLRGAFASLGDSATLGVLRDALAGDERAVAFALDLLEQAPSEDCRELGEELEHLLGHPQAEIRLRAAQLLEGVPGAVDPERLRQALADPEPQVREAVVRALAATESADEVAAELLGSDDQDVRTAALACMIRGELPMDGVRIPPMPQGTLSDPGYRAERALFVVARRAPEAPEELKELITDSDPRVAAAALWGAGFLADPRLHAVMAEALSRREVRQPAREALARLGPPVVEDLARILLDPAADPRVRREVPGVLARIPSPVSVAALVRAVVALETDQVLDHRAIKALSKLRARNPELAFDPARVDALLDRSLEASLHYGRAQRALSTYSRNGRPGVDLLARALGEARDERREEAFRCLGLQHPPDQIHRAYLAIARGERAVRSKALEWLENTVGFSRFHRMLPLLEEELPEGEAPAPAVLLSRLHMDEDRWVAACSIRAASELELEPADSFQPAEEPTMNAIERVFLLQQVDVLRDARSAHLALLAGIARVEDVEPGTTLVHRGEPASSLHVVVRGAVEVQGAGGDLTLTDGMALGTWALVDDVPSMVEARVTRPTRLLTIDREDFLDLLADHPELAMGMLQGLARRMRSLI